MAKTATTTQKRYVFEKTNSDGTSIDRLTFVGSWGVTATPIDWTDDNNIVYLQDDEIESWAFERDLDGLHFGYMIDNLQISYNVPRLNQDLLDILLDPFYSVNYSVIGETTGDTYTETMDFLANIVKLEIGIGGDNSFTWFGSTAVQIENDFSEHCLKLNIEYQSLNKAILENMPTRILGYLWDFPSFGAYQTEREFWQVAQETDANYGFVIPNVIYNPTFDFQNFMLLFNFGTIRAYLNDFAKSFFRLFTHIYTADVDYVLFQENFFLNGLYYKQKYDSTGERGATLDNEDDIYIGLQLANIVDSEITSIYTGGAIDTLTSNYKTFYDLFVKSIQSNLYKAFDNLDDADVYGVSLYPMLGTDEIEDILNLNIYEGTIKTKASIVSSVEAIPLEVVDKSINKYTSSSNFIYSDEKISVEVIFTNTPPILDKYQQVIYPDSTIYSSYKIQPMVLYYKDSVTVGDWVITNGFIRIHEANQFEYKSGAYTDAIIGAYTPVNSYIPINWDRQPAAWIAKYQGLEYLTGIYHVAAESILDIFKSTEQTIVELKNGTDPVSFKLLKPHLKYTIDLDSFNLSGKTLFTNYPTKYGITNITLTSDNETNITFLSQKY